MRYGEVIRGGARGLLVCASALTLNSVIAAEVQLPIPPAARQGPPAGTARVSPVTDAMLAKPPAQDWLMWRGTLNSWGYSPLTQVNTSNVNQLQLAWTHGLEAGPQEGTPLVHDGVMYFPHPGDTVEAIDAVSGDVIWEHRWKTPDDINKFINAPFINRNMAIYGNLVIDTTADGSLYAVDSRTGKQVWATQVLDYKTGIHQTSGPIVADGKVFSGRGCEPLPTSGPEDCVITAHDATTGRELWRQRTIPGPGEKGDETWGNVPYAERRHVGTWMPPSYDPELKLLYIGTSVTSPAPKFLLDGNDRQYLYHNSTLALDPATGKIVWYYQHVVDHWDMDHTFERMLVDTEVAPAKGEVKWINPAIKPREVRKVLTGIPGKTGIVYTLDRRTGEFLWARPTIMQNIVQDIDKTGRVTVSPDVQFSAKGGKALVCPSANGGKNWPAGAYSPLTKTMYFPMENTCMDVEVNIASRSERSAYGFRSTGLIAPGTTNLGSVHAINVASGHTEWKYEQRAATLSLLTTGGGLLFGGDVAGRFRAFDQKTGRIIWEVNLGSQVTGFPVSFAVNGRQYIAVSTGQAASSGGHLALTPEIRVGKNNNLYVFALPVSWQSARVAPRPATNAAVVATQVTAPIASACRADVPSPPAAAGTAALFAGGRFAADQVAAGKKLIVEQQCSICHAENLRGTPGGPALADAGFRGAWAGRPVEALFACTKTTMPPGRQGLMTDAQYVSLIATILSTNGMSIDGSGKLAVTASPAE